MKIKYITFLITLLFNSNIFSQGFKNYFQALNKADSLLYIEHDTSAYIKTLSQLQNRLFDEEYALSKIYLIIGDTLNSLKFAVKCFEKGASLEMFSNSYSGKNYSLLLKKNKNSSVKYLKNKDVSLDFIYGIYNLLGSDQLIRNLNNKNLVKDDEFKKVDSTNLKTLVELIDNYGFPILKTYGSKFHLFYILMIHLPYLEDEIYQRFLSYYTANLTKGAITPDLLAYFIDRHDYEKNGEQTYGTFANPYEGRGKIFNEKELDKRRMDMYLSSMKIFLAKRGVKE